MSVTDDRVRAVCTEGHSMSLWGNPLMAKPGELVSFWGSPFRCGTIVDGEKCQAAVYGGGRPQ